MIRDEGQQAGPASSTCLSAMIPKHAFAVWTRDHKQPVGGVAQNRELLSKLQHAKRCGLRMISQQPIRPNQVESYLKVALAEKPDKAPLVVRTWEVQEDGAANSFSSPDPLFELLCAPNLEEILRAGSDEGSRHKTDLQPHPGRVLTLLLRARQKCVSEYEAAGIVGQEGCHLST